MPKQEIPLLNLSLCVSVREYRGSARRARGLNSTIKKSYTPKTMTAFSISAQKLPFLRQPPTSQQEKCKEPIPPKI